MKKNTLKYVLDILLFIQVCSVVAVGILQGPEPGSSGETILKQKQVLKTKDFFIKSDICLRPSPETFTPEPKVWENKFLIDTAFSL
jgi:hypothetical protein